MEPVKNTEPIEEKEVKCEMCKKRKATEKAAKPYSDDVIDVCERCLEDILDEENE